MSEREVESHKEGFEFESWPFYWLARAERSYLMRLERALAPLGIDIPHWRVLSQLRQRKQSTISDLAFHAIVKLPTMTRIVQRMQADGFVQSGTSPDDARVTIVTLTPKGHEAGDMAWGEAIRIRQEAFRGFTPKQRETLTKLLRKLAERIED